MNTFIKKIFKEPTRINNLRKTINKRWVTNATSVSDRALFPGYKGDFSTNLEFIYPENSPQIQCYRVMNRKGVVLDPNHDPKVCIYIFF